MTVPAYAKEAFKISVKENATIYSSKTMKIADATIRMNVLPTLEKEKLL